MPTWRPAWQFTSHLPQPTAIPFPPHHRFPTSPTPSSRSSGPPHHPSPSACPPPRRRPSPSCCCTTPSSPPRPWLRWYASPRHRRRAARCRVRVGRFPTLHMMRLSLGSSLDDAGGEAEAGGALPLEVVALRHLLRRPRAWMAMATVREPQVATTMRLRRHQGWARVTGLRGMPR